MAVFLISVMSPFTIDSKDYYLLNNKCYLHIIYRLLPEELEPVSVLHGVILPVVGVTYSHEIDSVFIARLKQRNDQLPSLHQSLPNMMSL